MTDLDRSCALDRRPRHDVSNAVLLAGTLLLLVAAYAPTLYRVATTVWGSETQGQGPIVMALGLWLVVRRVRRSGLALLTEPRIPAGVVVALACAALLLAVGGVLAIPTLEILSLLIVMGCMLASLYGWPILRHTGIALGLMVFMVPLPESVVGTVTLPIKIAVSTAAEALLRGLDYPAARSGVVLYIGPYQLLIADACAGLNTLFTLEALGLLYVELSRSANARRNGVLSVLVVPIAFIANVLRVVTLCLLTYHFGDAVGQGFLHQGAGLFLMGCATAALVSVDRLLRLGGEEWRP